MSATQKPKKNEPTPHQDLTLLRAFLAALIADGQSEDALDIIVKLLKAMRDENSVMAIRLARLLREKFGKSSEKISRAQLDLFKQSIEEADPEKPDAPLPVPPPPELPPKKPRKRTGRNPLPADLPRETRRIEPSPEEQLCAICGLQKCVIGAQCSEILEYEPARFKVIVLERILMACKPCEGDVVIAPVADKPIEKGRPGPGLLARIVVAKFEESLPLHRLSLIFGRLGVAISDSTLGAWVAVIADYFEPIHRRLKELVLNSYVLGVDDTPLKILDRDHPAGVRRGHLWAYVGYEALVPIRAVYQYTPTWEQEGPCSFLKHRRGYIQGDGYAGYEPLFLGNPPQAVKVGCWTHCRRKYKDALDAGDLRAAEPLQFIANIYDTERLATSREATPEERRLLREQYAKPSCAALKVWAAKNKPWIEPKSPLAKAITFTINQWDSLQVYLEDGAVPIDNNRVEQRMRPVAIGRKNYLFAGSDAGAERAAILYSIIAACKLAEKNSFHYIRSVIDRLCRGWPASKLDELLPENWKPDPVPLSTPAPMPTAVQNLTGDTQPA